MVTRPIVFAAALGTLYCAHQLADHWIQRDSEARGKAAPGWHGRWLCARHVAGHAFTAAAMLAVTFAALGLAVSIPAAAAGLALSAATHYAADRRAPLAWLAAITGKAPLWQLGAPRPGRDDNPTLGTGAYALDQSWHIFWLWAAALVIAL